MSDSYYTGISALYAQKSGEWILPDDEHTYNRNMKINRDLMLKNEWDKRKITYHLNSEGFRSDGFNLDSGIMFLGCSFTFGIGIEDEHLWTKRIANHYQMTHWNLGQPGSGSDTCFRLGYHWIPILKPQIVVMMAPSTDRMEMIIPESSERVHYVGPWFPELNPRDTYYDYAMTQENGKLARTKNIKALRLICAQNNVKFVVKAFDDVLDIPEYRKRQDLGRDLEHPGIWGHDQIYQAFIKAIG